MEFNSEGEAQKHLFQLFIEQPNAILLECDKGFITFEITYSGNTDEGSYQYFPYTEDIIGVVISTNVNEVVVVNNLTDWIDLVDIAKGQADPDELDEIDFDEDSFFVPAYNGDYDYQFIKL
jgi:hypothetical protein